MQNWKQRPYIIANLFNPAFCALLLQDSISHYSQRRRNLGMPYSLAFLILPLVLHNDTRVALPSRTTALFHPWMQNNPEIRIGFPQRTRKFVPITKESLIFGLNMGVIAIENGDFIPARIIDTSLGYEKGTEVFECRKKAQFLGRWLAKIDDISMIFISLGVRP
jgi:hypothetical protein